VFTIWKHLEAFGSCPSGSLAAPQNVLEPYLGERANYWQVWVNYPNQSVSAMARLCSLFGSIWQHLEADCVRYSEAFGSIWKLIVFAILDCFDTEKTNQRK